MSIVQPKDHNLGISQKSPKSHSIAGHELERENQNRNECISQSPDMVPEWSECRDTTWRQDDRHPEFTKLRDKAECSIISRYRARNIARDNATLM